MRFIISNTSRSVPVVIVSSRPGDVEHDERTFRHEHGMPRHRSSRLRQCVVETDGLSDAQSVFDLAQISTTPPDVIAGHSLRRYSDRMREVFLSIATGPENASSMGNDVPVALASWLREQWCSYPSTPHALSHHELLYFATSSSRRADRINEILPASTAASQGGTIVDHGAGIGFLALCLALDQPKRFARVIAYEPNDRYVALGRDLWTRMGCGDRLEYHLAAATEVVYPDDTDVVLFAQMLFLIDADQRQDMLTRAWAALRPGGHMVINEIMDRRDSDLERPLLRSSSLIKALPTCENAAAWADTGPAYPLLEALRDGSEVFQQASNMIVLQKGLSDPSR